MLVVRVYGRECPYCDGGIRSMNVSCPCVREGVSVL